MRGGQPQFGGQGFDDSAEGDLVHQKKWRKMWETDGLWLIYQPTNGDFMEIELLEMMISSGDLLSGKLTLL